MKKADTETLWMPAPDDLDLESHQVNVWRISLSLHSAAVESLQSTLSEGESQRAARFHFTKDRDHYIVSHGGLRDILARYLRCEPGQLNFSTGEYGKPALIPDKGLEFNLAHSGNYALIAITCGRKIGVDVEHIRQNMEFERIANRFFSPNEISELMTLPPDQREVAFFNCWTRKEAYIKAQGLGLSLPLDSFDVSLTPDEPALLRATRPDSQEAARWFLLALEVDVGYAAAIATEKSQGLELRLWDWNRR